VRQLVAMQCSRRHGRSDRPTPVIEVERGRQAVGELGDVRVEQLLVIELQRRAGSLGRRRLLARAVAGRWEVFGRRLTAPVFERCRVVRGERVRSRECRQRGGRLRDV